METNKKNITIFVPHVCLFISRMNLGLHDSLNLLYTIVCTYYIKHTCILFLIYVRLQIKNIYTNLWMYLLFLLLIDFFTDKKNGVPNFNRNCNDCSLVLYMTFLSKTGNLFGEIEQNILLHICNNRISNIHFKFQYESFSYKFIEWNSWRMVLD